MPTASVLIVLIVLMVLIVLIVLKSINRCGKRGVYTYVSQGVTGVRSTHYSSYLEHYRPCAGGLSAADAIQHAIA